MRIRLSDHFTYGRLLRYTLPSIVMMIFTSIYSIVDGLFVSNYAGKEALAAVNLVYPILMILSAVGFMFGAGGSAIVARMLGEGKKERANEYFSLLIAVTFGIGVVSTVLVELFIPQLVVLLGAEGNLVDLCVLYGRLTARSTPFFMLQTSFQTYFNTAEKPRLGLAVTVISGLMNIVLDFLLVGVFGMGLAGAATATNISEVVGGSLPLIYFFRKNDSLLRFRRFHYYGKVIAHAAGNGSSEMLSNMSSSVVSILYNYILLDIAGSDGVAAYGAIMYVGFIFAAITIGFTSGSAPIISFHYGAENLDELKNLFRRCTEIVAVFGVAMFLLAQIAAPALTGIFVGYDRGLYEMTLHGYRICAFMFLIFGMNIYSSSLFTALGNGLISAILSTLRTLVFPVAALLVLPKFFGLDGVWASTVAAELAALAVSVFFMIRERNRYGYA